MNIQFHESDGKTIKKGLLSEEAEHIADKLVKREGRNVNGVRRHQFRRLYDEVQRFKRKLEYGTDWENIEPLVKMVISKTAYMTSRMISKEKKEKKNKEFYERFNEFISSCLKKVNNQKDFETFCLLLEAVYGFYYSKGGADTQ